MILVLAETDFLFEKVWRMFSQYRKMTYNNFYDRWRLSSKAFLIKIHAEFVGYVLITTRNEIGYLILPGWQNKGIGKKAVILLMQKVKRKYYWALIDNNNPFSQRLIKSLGFKPTAISYSWNRR